MRPQVSQASVESHLDRANLTQPGQAGMLATGGTGKEGTLPLAVEVVEGEAVPSLSESSLMIGKACAAIVSSSSECPNKET